MYNKECKLTCYITGYSSIFTVKTIMSTVIAAVQQPQLISSATNIIQMYEASPLAITCCTFTNGICRIIIIELTSMVLQLLGMWFVAKSITLLIVKGSLLVASGRNVWLINYT